MGTLVGLVVRGRLLLLLFALLLRLTARLGFLPQRLLLRAELLHAELLRRLLLRRLLLRHLLFVLLEHQTLTFVFDIFTRCHAFDSSNKSIVRTLGKNSSCEPRRLKASQVF